MSNHNIEYLKKKINATELAMKERSDRYEKASEQAEEYTLLSELDVLERMHTSLIDAYRIVVAYDKVSDEMVDL